MMARTGTLRQYGVRGVLSRLWAGERAVKSYTMSPTDPRLAAIMADYFGSDEEKSLRSPYKQLPVVYSCIQAKARNIAKVPFVLKTIADDEPLAETHPLVSLFNQPNSVTSAYEFWQGIVVSLDTGGNFFAVPDDSQIVDGYPTRMWLMTPQITKKWMRTDGTWVGWEFARGSTKLQKLADEVIHGKYWNPDDEIWGLRPLGALGMSNSINWNSLRYARLFFQNDATPSVVIESEKAITGKQRDDLKQELYENRKGVEKAHSFLILGGMTAKNLVPNNKDIQLLETMNATVDQVCMVFGVPKTELSLYEDSNRATAFTQDRGFWTKTLLPLMSMIESTFNAWLRQWGVYGMFDTGKVDALRYDLVDKLDAALKLMTLGYPVNMINDRLDLGFEDVPWGDEPTYGAGLPPLDSQPAPQQDVPIEDTNATKGLLVDDAQISDALMGAKWKKLDDQILPLMAKAAKRTRGYFISIERRLRERLVKSLRDAVTKDAAEKVPDSFDWIGDLFSDEKLRRELGSVLDEASRRGVDTLGPEIGVRFNAPDALAAAAVRLRVTKLADINDTAKRQVKEALRKALAKAIEDGMSEQDAAQYIVQQMREAMSINVTRAKTIARTETHGAFSDGRWDAMHKAGVTRKRWISSRDTKVRDSHRKYERMGPIAVDDEFGPGLKRPHDPNGKAADTINCRCKCVAVIDAEQRGAPQDETRLERIERVVEKLSEKQQAARLEVKLRQPEDEPKRRRIVKVQRDEAGDLVGAEIVEEEMDGE